MTRDEADACLRILAAIARADGSISADEARALAHFGGAEGDKAAADAQSSRVDITREAKRIRSAEARRATFEAAIAMAEVDSRCTREEHAVLVELRNALELDDVVDVLVAEREWAQQMTEPLRALADADRGFLLAVARERDAGELSNERYVAMVDDLRREHARVLADVLPHLTKD